MAKETVNYWIQARAAEEEYEYVRMGLEGGVRVSESGIIYETTKRRKITKKIVNDQPLPFKRKKWRQAE